MKDWKGFERGVAKMVVETFKDYGISNKDCFRTPMSGGHRYARQTDPGDLVISPRLRKLFPVHVECKCYATVNMAQFLFPVSAWKKSWKCSMWLKQMEEAKVGNLLPLLVFKENNGVIMAAFPLRGAFSSWAELSFKNKMVFKYHGEEWYMVRFETFLRKALARHDR